tara:strand:- start:1604 stop:1945 length:342 start_codon:yes stop_codon:yes gene_type:complete
MRKIVILATTGLLSCISMESVLDAGAKAKDKYEKFEEANPDFIGNMMSGDTARIVNSLNNFERIKTDEEKAREDSIKALEKAEQDSILKLMRESFVDELFKKYGTKKDTVENK